MSKILPIILSYYYVGLFELILLLFTQTVFLRSLFQNERRTHLNPCPYSLSIHFLNSVLASILLLLLFDLHVFIAFLFVNYIKNLLPQHIRLSVYLTLSGSLLLSECCCRSCCLYLHSSARLMLLATLLQL